VVLSGYPNPNSAAGAGIILTDLISSMKGAKGYSRMVDNMVLGPFSKAVPGAKTPQDWLSVNEENVQIYREDPLCGARFTLGSYSTLFHLIKLMGNAGKYEEVWKELPILMISGREDPCTGGEKGRKDSEAVLRKAGFREIQVVTLDGMRHEILNETGREEVYRRILEFINS
jgi:alpha-beta hydrolase superfamily lysophospholipase